MKPHAVSIILPALNEELTIGRVIDEIPKEALQKLGYRVEVVVVDNNSNDGTARVAKERGAKVIVEPVRGKGKAIRKGFESVRGDFVFMLDADYTYPATYIPQMLGVLQGGYDVVIGSRLKGKLSQGAMSNMNLVGNRLLALVASLLYGKKISDLCTGYWGFTRKAVKNLDLDAKGFEIEAAIFASLARKGYRIVEVPVQYRRRATPSKLSDVPPLDDTRYNLIKGGINGQKGIQTGTDHQQAPRGGITAAAGSNYRRCQQGNRGQQPYLLPLAQRVWRSEGRAGQEAQGPGEGKRPAEEAGSRPIPG